MGTIRIQQRHDLSVLTEDHCIFTLVSEQMRHREASSASGRKKINSGDMEGYVIEEGAASV